MPLTERKTEGQAARSLGAGLLLLLLLSFPAAAGLIYQTDFENFTAGPNRWVGTDGWLSGNNTTGSHGIDQDVIPGGGLGKTAYLGYLQPASSQTVVSRSIPYDPALTGVPRIEFQIALGIQDSTNGRRDNFYVYFYNASGQALATIGFLNAANQGITRSDGSSTTTTAASFLHGELQLLSGRIDLVANLWSAELDGVPLFQNVVFNNSGRTRTLGSLAFMWLIPGGQPANFGNNWLLVADILVRSSPQGSLPFVLDGFTHSPSRQSTLVWTAQPGYDYRVAWSQDLKSWHLDLPGASFPTQTSTLSLQFSDTPPAGTPCRFYRVIRSESP